MCIPLIIETRLFTIYSSTTSAHNTCTSSARKVDMQGKRYSQTGFVLSRSGTPQNVEVVEFNPEQSRMVCFAINEQCHEKLKTRSLGQTVINDANLISDTFANVGAIPQCNATVHYETSAQPSVCTYEGMKKRFVHAAGSVGNDGLFAFHFFGHCIQVKSDQWVLAPSDFDFTERTYVSGDVINDWLTEADCKAKHVLFILDCCYAGGIAEALAFTEIAHRSVFVLGACAVNEISFSFEILGNSIFSYFLSYAIKRNAECRSGSQNYSCIPLQRIYEDCHYCCEALASLYITCTTKGGLVRNSMHPQMKWLRQDQDETDSAAETGWFELVNSHYDLTHGAWPLHKQTEDWLDVLRDPNGPLSKLRRRGLLQQKEVLLTALASMMYSVGSFQLKYDTLKVSGVNAFITAYLIVASVIECNYSKVHVEFSALHFKIAIEYYTEALIKNNHPTDPLDDLYATICKELEHPN